MFVINLIIMKKILFIISISIIITKNLYSQVGINNDGSVPDPSSMLDVKSTDKGILIPRMTSAERDNISSPAKGLVVFVTDDNNFYYWDGSQWINTATQPDLDWQINGNDMYVIPGGNLGVGTTTPTNKLDVTSSSNNIIGYFTSTRTNQDDIAVAGKVNNTDYYGIGGDFSGGWIGVRSLLSPTGTGQYYGLRTEISGGSGTNFGVYSSTSGTGTNFSGYFFTDVAYNKGTAGYFSNFNSTGIGLIALGSGVSTYYTPLDGAAIAATGKLIGIEGFTDFDDNNATAIYGKYNGTGQYHGTGIIGYSVPQVNYGYGVKGIGGYIGVYGEAQNGLAGVYASDNNGTSTYAFYGDGDLYVTGDLGAGGAKTFMIDHPLDPENKILKHFALESNEVLNVYRGNVILNAKGKAIVKLPSYFKAINTNYSYTLTPIGAPAPGLYIEKEIDNKGRFKIAGGKAGQKVSWYVYAERNDAYMKKHKNKKKTEVYKKGKLKGKYLQPELYGKSKMKAFSSKRFPKESKKQIQPKLTKLKIHKY